MAIRPSVVRAYARAMTQQQSEGGLRFPAIVLFTDGSHYWLGDGYHRVLAAREAGLNELLAEIYPGTQRDALLYAISANTDHGLPRTNADKRKAVWLLLSDSEWHQWSNREIARRCGVGSRFVDNLRKVASAHGAQMPQRKVRRGDRVYEMAVRQADPVKENITPGADFAVTPPAGVTPGTDRLGIAIPPPSKLSTRQTGP